jgi:ubiquinone/menaquinone biosynthesis C-methylase UbiE
MMSVSPASSRTLSACSSPAPNEVCITGHNPSVRTAANSAAYLIPFLIPAPAATILDVGCGSASITCDFASLCPDGHVTGVDSSPDVIKTAREAAEKRNLSNTTFLIADITQGLGFPDNCFDVIHAHQVLQHLTDPTAALREMRRVVKRGGLVAAGDSDWGGMSWYPPIRELEEWMALHISVVRDSGCKANLAMVVQSLAQVAGFERWEITKTRSAWEWRTKEEREWWAATMVNRILEGVFATIASQADLGRITAAWREWASHDDAWFIVPHVEILCRKRYDVPSE